MKRAFKILLIGTLCCVVYLALGAAFEPSGAFSSLTKEDMAYTQRLILRELPPATTLGLAAATRALPYKTQQLTTLGTST